MSHDLSIINAAATRTGNNPISALTDGVPVAAISSSNYENLVKAELAAYPWKRATKIQQLDRLDPDTHGDPPEPWTAAYTQPDDMLEIRTVKVDGYPVNYEVHGNTILCDAAEDSEVILHYIWRVHEAQWPAWFREGMIQRCEAMFLRGVGERYREAQARDDSANAQFAMAKNRDAQSQTPRDPTISPTLRARGVSYPPVDHSWPWPNR